MAVLVQRVRIRLTKDEFIDKLECGYELISEYKNMSTAVTIRHSCGYTYHIQPSRLLINKPKCRKCLGYYKTHDDFISEVYELYKDEYLILGKYNNAKSKIKVKHTDCEYEYEVTPTNLLSGKKCPKCYGSIKLTNSEFIELVNINGKGEYITLNEYVNNKTTISFKHLKCNTIYKTKAYHFLHSRSRCPNCLNYNKAENELKEYLIDKLNNSRFKLKTQYWFDGLRGLSKNPYYFDFAILDDKDELILLIERNGSQHYEYNKFIHKDISEFEKRVIVDNIKYKYCIDNDISLEIIEAKKTNYKKECGIIDEILNKYDIVNNV